MLFGVDGAWALVLALDKQFKEGFETQALFDELSANKA